MGTLYTVATPIGNLADITVRALDVLKTVDLIVCEDTRMTSRLLKHYEITTQMATYHQHSTAKHIENVIKQLKTGKNIAMVSDAGTPTISDPGYHLLQAAVTEGITIVPIPGPSALITALQAAGVNTSSFVFLGFLPHKKGRQTLLTEVAEAKRTMVFYESPHRIMKALYFLKDCDRKIVIGRELTKMYEEFLRGTAAEVYKEMNSREAIKGEFVVIVHD